MTFWQFTGDSALTYPAYIDLATYRTLIAQPGQQYDMQPAGGLDLPVPPADGRWDTVAEPAQPVMAAAPKPAPKPEPEPAPDAP